MKSKMLLAALVGLASLASVPAFAKGKYPTCKKPYSVSVNTFDTEGRPDWWNDSVAGNMRNMVIDELSNSGCFTVSQGKKKGGAYVVQFALASVTAGADSVRIGGLGGLGGKIKRDEVQVSCRLLKAGKRGDVVASSSVKKSGMSFGVDVSKFGSYAEFESSKLGKTMAGAVHDCAVDLAETISSR